MLQACHGVVGQHHSGSLPEQAGGCEVPQPSRKTVKRVTSWSGYVRSANVARVAVRSSTRLLMPLLHRAQLSIIVLSPERLGARWFLDLAQMIVAGLDLPTVLVQARGGISSHSVLGQDIMGQTLFGCCTNQYLSILLQLTNFRGSLIGV